MVDKLIDYLSFCEDKRTLCFGKYGQILFVNVIAYKVEVKASIQSLPSFFTRDTKHKLMTKKETNKMFANGDPNPIFASALMWKFFMRDNEKTVFKMSYNIKIR